MQDPAPNVMFLVEVVNCNDGIASYCETLATGLHGRGVQIHLVSGAVRSDEKSEYKRQKLAAAVKEWHVIPGLRKLPSLSIFMRLLKLIRKNNITVINVHGLGMLMWGRLLALLTGARCVATYHPSVLGNIEKVQNAPQSTFSPVQVLFFNERAVGVTLPNFVLLRVTGTEGGVAGNTAAGNVTKPATLETGAVVAVPLFINEGDLLKIDTRERAYVERVKG